MSVDDGSGEKTVGSIAFAQSTRWSSVRSGRFRWTLSGAGGKTLATGRTTVGDGAYDLLVMEHGTAVTVGVYKAEGGTPGSSLVRVIHGAPELGSPELTVDGKVAVKSLAYGQATPYVSLPAGSHKLGAERQGGGTPLVSGTLTAKSGRSYSAVVLGTRGQRVRVVTLVDRGAPLVRTAAKRSSGQGAAPGGATSTVVVHPGDSLWSIARGLVGADASDQKIQRKLVSIWDANQRRIGTGDPNLIFPGTKLRV